MNRSSDTMKPDGLDKWRLLYGAYEFLKTEVAPETSSTARMLCNPDWQTLRGRLADELRELAGVAEGTHIHGGMPEDMVLEASQVCYWTFMLAVGVGFSVEEIISSVATGEHNLDAESLVARLPDLAAAIERGDSPPAVSELQTVWRAAILCCAAHGISANTPAQYDLAQLQSRAYMQPYFSV